MPIYEYQCEKCKMITEKIQSYDGKAPKCGKCKIKTHRVISRTSFALKGEGWAKDGYAKGIK